MKNIIMKQLAINKGIITYLHEHIEALRFFKRQADERGNLEDEYNYHNALTKSRKDLKGYVQIQKTLKALMRG